jgi:starch synthase (maltosyl-transferring)
MNAPESRQVLDIARVAIEDVTPCVDGGRFAAKRVVGDVVKVTAAAFADGHDQLAVALRVRHESATAWTEVPMKALGNDRWEASFEVDRLGTWHYAVHGWVDPLATWREQFERREDPADLRRAALTGSELIAVAAACAQDAEREQLSEWAAQLNTGLDPAAMKRIGLDESLFQLARRHAARPGVAQSPELRIMVERVRARFGAWYELFPRSFGKPGQHGTFADVEGQLDRIAAMGFDVVYLPPIHPVGRTNRKGANNSRTSQPGEPGSPWAIGASEGGHKATHPELGTLAEFRKLLDAARTRDLEIAIDIAYQCAPDHPYIQEHPEWFRRAPDGTLQYAENPPKKYEDIYPFDFESPEAPALWMELLSIVTFWIGQGVRIFRVDNPHTKPFAFWEWMIGEVKRRHPQVIFLSEAFTRPRIMHRLAKLGFSQSYTYFTWRTTREELTEYFTELAHGPGRDYFRPNAWPNTPDILPYHLHHAPIAMFRLRYVLAATLAATYGMYGPAYELGINKPFKRDSEEYLESEKYEIKAWDLAAAKPFEELIAQVNAIRRQHRALQSNDGLAFHETDNEMLIAYSKRAGDDVVLVVVNLEAALPHSGWVTVDAEELGLEEGESFQVRDLLGGGTYTWTDGRNYVHLDPERIPAHVFAVSRVAG